jgi:hypothetical protein
MDERPGPHIPRYELTPLGMGAFREGVEINSNAALRAALDADLPFEKLR